MSGVNEIGPIRRAKLNALRAKFVQAIMAEWDKNRPTQNSTMSIQAANACIAVLESEA